MALLPSHLLVTTLSFVVAATLLYQPEANAYVLGVHDDEGLATAVEGGTDTSQASSTISTTTESSTSSPATESGGLLGPRGMRLDDHIHEPTTGSSTPAATQATHTEQGETGHSTTDDSTPTATALAERPTTAAVENDEEGENKEEDAEDKAYKLVANYFREPSHHTYQVAWRGLALAAKENEVYWKNVREELAAVKEALAVQKALEEKLPGYLPKGSIDNYLRDFVDQRYTRPGATQHGEGTKGRVRRASPGRIGGE